MAPVLRRLVPLVFLALFWVPSAYAWSWPVPGPVLQQFSFDPAHPYAAGQHRGSDLGAPAGAGVVAPAAGTVGFAGSVPTNGTSLTILTADGYSVTLTHLGTLVVSRGATVAEGDLVGTVGPSGAAELDVPYVHLGIRLANDPNGYLDPLTLLPALGPPAPPGSPDASAAPVASPASPVASPAMTVADTPAATPASTAPAATEPETSTPHASAPEASEPPASAPATAAPAHTPAAHARPAAVRPPVATRREHPSRPASEPARSGVRRSEAVAHATVRAHGVSRSQPVVDEPVPLRHRPVPVSPPASPRERRVVAEARPSVVPFALGAGTAILVLAALAGVLRVRRRPVSPPELGAVVIPLPRRPDRLAERRVA